MEQEARQADEREEIAEQQLRQPMTSEQRAQRERELDEAKEESQQLREELEEAGRRLQNVQVGSEGVGGGLEMMEQLQEHLVREQERALVEAMERLSLNPSTLEAARRALELERMESVRLQQQVDAMVGSGEGKEAFIKS